jgi:hypothetical protein
MEDKTKEEYKLKFEAERLKLKEERQARMKEYWLALPKIEKLEDVPFIPHVDEKEYKELQKRFFRYSSRFSIFSDYLVDSAAALLQNKKIIFFSWEKRKCNIVLLYPQFSKDYRQQDMPNWVNNGHLNESGMKLLTDIVINEYELKK